MDEITQYNSALTLFGMFGVFSRIAYVYPICVSMVHIGPYMQLSPHFGIYTNVGFSRRGYINYPVHSKVWNIAAVVNLYV